MSKAFDSVGLDPLRKALERIKIKKSIINLIIFTFQDRMMKVLTEYGPSDLMTAGDGIDQGDCISPLLWRIFYDPLLTRVYRSGLGYKSKVLWPKDTSTMS